jgi:hypothetical protein
MALFFSLLFDAYGVKKGVLHDNCLVVNFSCFVNFLQKKTWERVISSARIGHLKQSAQEMC